MARKPASQKIEIVDKSITVRSIDRSKKTLDSWRVALIAAESVVQPVRQRLYDIYAEVYLDEHLRSVIDQRRLALTRTRLTFKRNGEEVDAITALIGKRFFRQALRHIVDARFWGYSLIMIDFAGHQTKLVSRPHVLPHTHLVAPTPYDTTGIDYTAAPYDTLYMDVGEEDDLGLLISACPLVLLKRGDVLDWATFNELYGQPLRKGTYNPLDPAQKTQLEQALASMGSVAHVVVPEGAKIEFVESGQKAGAAQTFEGLASRCDKGLSKLFVGQTMTTEDGASKSQGEVHERVADSIAKDDQDHVLGYLNEQGLAMLAAQGFDVAGGQFEFIEEEADIPKDKQLEMDISIHTKVGRLKKAFFQENYNVDFVDDSDEAEVVDPVADDPAEEGDSDPSNADKPDEKGDKPKPNSDKPDKGKQKNAAGTEQDMTFVTRLRHALADFFDQPQRR